MLKEIRKKATREKTQKVQSEAYFLTHCSKKTRHRIRSGTVAFERQDNRLQLWRV